eukprot:1145378-Pelagomonas_calceolata.AAC.17
MQGGGEPANEPQGTGDPNPPASGPLPDGPAGQQGEGTPPAGHEQGGPDAAGTGAPSGTESGDAGKAADGADKQEGGGSGTDDTKPSKDTGTGKKPSSAQGKAKENPSSDLAKSDAKGDKPAAAKKPGSSESTKQGSKAAKPDANGDSKGDKPAAAAAAAAAAKKPGSADSAKPGSSESTKQGSKAPKPDANGDKPAAAAAGKKPGSRDSAKPDSDPAIAERSGSPGAGKSGKPGSKAGKRQKSPKQKPPVVEEEVSEDEGPPPNPSWPNGPPEVSARCAWCLYVHERSDQERAAACSAGMKNLTTSKLSSSGNLSHDRGHACLKDNSPCVVRSITLANAVLRPLLWDGVDVGGAFLLLAGGTYVPVAELPPLPEAHGFNEEGQPVPLPGVEPQLCLQNADHREAVNAGSSFETQELRTESSLEACKDRTWERWKSNKQIKHAQHLHFAPATATLLSLCRCRLAQATHSFKRAIAETCKDAAYVFRHHHRDFGALKTTTRGQACGTRRCCKGRRAQVSDKGKGLRLRPNFMRAEAHGYERAGGGRR